MKLQITIEKMENIISIARENAAKDTSLSHTVTIEIVGSVDTQTGNDAVLIYQKSSYAECESKLIGH